MQGVVTSTLSFPVLSNESLKLFVEVVKRLTAAGKELFHFFDHLLTFMKTRQSFPKTSAGTEVMLAPTQNISLTTPRV